MLKNPFLLYILTFGAVLCAYQLNWSAIYPELPLGLLLFFGITFFISLLFSYIIRGEVRNTGNYAYGRLPRFTFPLLMVGFAADMIYAGGIPLWWIITGQPYNYAEFGIPTLHVAIVTLSGSFVVIRFADYLYSKRSRHLFEVLTVIGYDILIINRAAVLIAMISFGFILIIKCGGLGWKRGLVVTLVALVVFYGFGVLGDLRSGDVIKEIGKPTEAFYRSRIPGSYFWTYVYMTSPMANFAETMLNHRGNEGGLAQMVASEMLPDFISKHILPLFHADRLRPKLIAPSLNVGSLFSRSYVYLGWLGISLMFMVFTLHIIVYIVMIRKSPYRVPALALLNTLVVFCIFDNMISFSGMSLQLAWPLILQIRLKDKKSM